MKLFETRLDASHQRVDKIVEDTHLYSNVLLDTSDTVLFLFCRLYSISAAVTNYLSSVYILPIYQYKFYCTISLYRRITYCITAILLTCNIQYHFTVQLSLYRRIWPEPFTPPTFALVGHKTQAESCHKTLHSGLLKVDV
jgi:hypothetical protein